MYVFLLLLLLYLHLGILTLIQKRFTLLLALIFFLRVNFIKKKTINHQDIQVFIYLSFLKCLKVLLN